jgi:hypothetical protein
MFLAKTVNQQRMSVHRYSCVLILLVFAGTACNRSAQPSAGSQTGNLDGQIFIVTQGADTIKLSLTDVLIFKEAEIDSTLAAYRDKAKTQRDDRLTTIQNKLHALQNKLETYKRDDPSETDPKTQVYVKAAQMELGALTQEYQQIDEPQPDQLFSNLPRTAFAKATTDADGKFSVRLPKTGRYVLAAAKSRDTGVKTEHYYWLIRVSLDGADSKTLNLTNNNLIGSSSPESIL